MVHVTRDGKSFEWDVIATTWADNRIREMEDKAEAAEHEDYCNTMYDAYHYSIAKRMDNYLLRHAVE